MTIKYLFFECIIQNKFLQRPDHDRRENIIESKASKSSINLFLAPSVDVWHDKSDEKLKSLHFHKFKNFIDSRTRKSTCLRVFNTYGTGIPLNNLIFQEKDRHVFLVMDLRYISRIYCCSEMHLFQMDFCDFIYKYLFFCFANFDLLGGRFWIEC